MSCLPTFKNIAQGNAAGQAALTRAVACKRIVRRSATRSSWFSVDGIDSENRWNANAITVGMHARTGAARLNRQHRRRCQVQSRRSGRHYARRTRPLWLMKCRPRHRRFCSIRARSRP
jgi:hypothetical protein